MGDENTKKWYVSESSIIEHKGGTNKIFFQAGYGIRFEKNRHKTNVNATVDNGLHSITWVPTAHIRKPEYPGWRINLYNKAEYSK
jgi:hypothetical protein